MPKSKNRKNHKAKVAKRNERINQEKRALDKKSKAFLKKIIEQEKNSGKFDNVESIDEENSEND